MSALLETAAYLKILGQTCTEPHSRFHHKSGNYIQHLPPKLNSVLLPTQLTCTKNQDLGSTFSELCAPTASESMASPKEVEVGPCEFCRHLLPITELIKHEVRTRFMKGSCINFSTSKINLSHLSPGYMSTPTLNKSCFSPPE